MATQKKKTRMYEPWGYRDENNYQSTEIIHENDLDSFFSGVSYKREDNKIHFTNRDGFEVGSLNVNDFIKSDQIVEKAWYENGNIYIKFTNGDQITVDVRELLDENEFADGLQVIDGVVSVLRDATSERWLTVSSDGVKVSGIQAEIDRLDKRIDDEIDRAVTEEKRIDKKLDNEIARSIVRDNELETLIDNETKRAKGEEERIDNRVDVLNDELDAEKSARESNDAALALRITTEVTDRTNANQSLNDKIEAEIIRAKKAEDALDKKIENVTSGSSDYRLDELIEKLGYKDNDTLVRSNTNEVAFGQYNVSNTSTNPSGQTVFSVGIGTSESDRKNAIEVRMDGSIFMWVEGEFINVNKVLGQIAHETY